VWENGTGHSPELWSHLSGMGVLSIMAPESDGGMGGSFVDAILLFQELGRAAVPGPVLEHMAVAVPALASTTFGAPLIAGDSIATLWVDDSPYVAHAAVANVIVRKDHVLESFDATDAHGMDGGRRLFTVAGGERTNANANVGGLDPFDAMALASAAYLIGLSERMILIIRSAYLIGLSERMIEIAAEYARVREQFGKPIGSFQAVKHLMSDALLKVEFAKAPTYRAAFSASTGADTTIRDISMAKALASEAAYRTSRSTMQVHGGIGYTWEADLQLWMKKAWALMRSYGDANFHRRRVSGFVLA
jgi:alkylation response protein AidB-like acyl-CoA dehydrogenase